ncbi:hypothetical protein EPUS_05690 [Endocarpon pusillum Z07020]|uniref:AAA+ ATPase domain-containing protein n=1 Tax=Endocarpon pusillum (strain Z07020 / HMAS-L-300199) TaxID=1263415 RepID=U1GL99_ENDPU|nr:uncharacterized protein EPUS_05690 [Endocarpon pusillum Z07020]ERF72636.1 hypothetical protein EPUS_05690 [Endocarpon pusillum Z07020]
MSTEIYNKALKATKSAQDEKASVAPEYKPELADITELEDRWGYVKRTSRTADQRQYLDDDRYASYAMVLRRRLNDKEQPKFTQLEIRSPLIRKLLQVVCGDNDLVNTAASVIIISSPYLALFLYRNEIRKYVEECKPEADKIHVSILVAFINRHLKVVESELERLLPSYRISFAIAWTLLRPGTIVVAQRDYYEECYVVETLNIVQTQTGPELHVNVRGWDYNGARFGPVARTMIIPYFPGVRQITALEIYPISFHQEKDGGDLSKRLTERGYKWRKMLNKTHKSYKGKLNLAWTTPFNRAESASVEGLVARHYSGRVMLDYTSHQQANPSQATILSESSAKAGTANNTKDSEAVDIPTIKDHHLSYPDDSTYEMTPDQAFLCPARIRGFSLTDKTWAFFLVDSVNDISWGENTLKRLEIDPEIKETLKALVNTHSKKEGRLNGTLDDIISGKGQGLVFLLSGAPGLGKTLTAECIAEELQLPLYSITSGELGTDVAKIDVQLRNLFSRARSWQAILLLDEADVFLAKRQTADLKRNALVSVFLRSIEYYQGILFLTTNRSKDFDEAFQSRIHFKIHYKPLDAKRRAILWRNLHQSLNGSNGSMWDEAVYSRFGQEFEINGREIKNIFNTAISVAEYDKEILKEEHVRRVYDLSLIWRQGANEEETSVD